MKWQKAVTAWCQWVPHLHLNLVFPLLRTYEMTLQLTKQGHEGNASKSIKQNCILQLICHNNFLLALWYEQIVSQYFLAFWQCWHLTLFLSKHHSVTCESFRLTCLLLIRSVHVWLMIYCTHSFKVIGKLLPITNFKHQVHKNYLRHSYIIRKMMKKWYSTTMEMWRVLNYAAAGRWNRLVGWKII